MKNAFASIRNPLAVLFMVAVMGCLSATALASPATPGCDMGAEPDYNSGLWDVMKTHADAQRVRDAAYGSMHNKPDSGTAVTCFDLAMSLSARLGGIFADIAGGFNLSVDLPNVSAWADAFVNFNAIAHYGRATPAFFPPKEMPPPLGALLDTATGLMNEFGAEIDAGGSMNLYNPFGNLGGLRFNLFGEVDMMNLLTIYTKMFTVGITLQIPEFEFSIGANLGIDVMAGLLANLQGILDLSIPVIPNFELPFVQIPDLAFSFSGMLCGSIGSIGGGFDMGPLQTVLEAIISVLDYINAFINIINKFINFLNGILGQIQAVLAIAADLLASASLYARMDASFAGMDLVDFHLGIPIPWITPGCLLSTAIWVGKEFVKNPDNASGILRDAAGVPIDMVTDPVAAANQAKSTLEDGLGVVADYASRAEDYVEQGMAYAGPMLGAPFFTYEDLASSFASGINGGSLRMTGQFQTSVNAGILMEAEADLNASLVAPSNPGTKIEVWVAPTTANPKTSSSCQIVMEMPGADIAGCID